MIESSKPIYKEDSVSESHTRKSNEKKKTRSES